MSTLIKNAPIEREYRCKNCGGKRFKLASVREPEHQTTIAVAVCAKCDTGVPLYEVLE